MKIREYSIETKKLNSDIRICVVSDMHSMPYSKCLDAVIKTCSDIIICAGDMLERLDGVADIKNERGFELLGKLCGIAPTFYSFGNHECFGSHREMRREPNKNIAITEANYKLLQDTGVTLLEDSYICYSLKGNSLRIAGITPVKERGDLNVSVLNEFFESKDFKILISHQPEYYDVIKDRDFDLMISGHTHGGQWSIFGQGVYAPNQGLFPKYSSGVYDERLVVSAGAANTQKPIPRLFNPCEIVVLNFKSQ